MSDRMAEGPAIEIKAPHQRPIYANTTWKLTDDGKLLQITIERAGMDEVPPTLLAGDDIRIGGMVYHVVTHRKAFFTVIEGSKNVFEYTLKKGPAPPPPEWLKLGNLDLSEGENPDVPDNKVSQ